MPYYAITLKENSIPMDKLCESMYYDWFNQAKDKGLSIVKVTYEYDEQWRLHAHALGYAATENIYKRKFIQKNMHQNLQLLKTQDDVVRWMIYMYKTYDYNSSWAQFCCIKEKSGIDIEGPARGTASATPDGITNKKGETIAHNHNEHE